VKVCNVARQDGSKDCLSSSFLDIPNERGRDTVTDRLLSNAPLPHPPTKGRSLVPFFHPPLNLQSTDQKAKVENTMVRMGLPPFSRRTARVTAPDLLNGFFSFTES